MNMNMIMQQAKKMQKDMENAKEEVSKMLFTSKQSLVEVTVNGDKVITNIKINEDISIDDIEILQDMIMLTVNDAISQANKAMEDKLGSFASGIPGIF